VQIAVASRPPTTNQADQSSIGNVFSDKQTQDPQLLQLTPQGHVLFDQSLQINLASNELRDGFYSHVSRGELADAIPPLVLEYIEAKGLYRNK
jgi:nicotinate-nucleotide adenylyltransferase